MSSVKKEPSKFNNQGGVAGLIREFRIDEESGMHHTIDPKLEPRQGGFNNSNQILDRVTLMRRDKLN